MKPKILIIHDSTNFIELLRKTLKNFCPKDNELELLVATNEQGAITLLRENQDIKVILLDFAMENEDLCKRIFAFIRQCLKNDTIQTLFINKDKWDSEIVKTNIAEKLNTYDDLLSVTPHVHKHEISKTVIRKDIEDKMGNGKVISKVFDQIEKFAKTDIPILLEGETGTGKELIANYLWKNSLRKEMRTLNCGSLSSELAGSELFGHSKGAFTSADKETTGLLKIIDGGILFLDEINSLPLEVQVKLLRVIENGTFERIGDKKEFKVNVRIIAAGNESFRALIEKGKFREDLYERFPKKIYIPTLKERFEDFNHFIDFFLSDESNKCNKQIVISNEARKLLSEYEWKGNVRQLKNTIANLVVEAGLDKKSKKYIIQSELIKECLRDNYKIKDDIQDNDFSLQRALDIATKKAIIRALEEAKGHNENAIKLLRIARGTYYKEKERLGIE